MNSVSVDVREAYREGVEALVAGDAAAAILRLEPLADEAAPFEIRLALGKAYLAAGRGADALVRLQDLCGAPDADPGLAAYLELLLAAAEGLDGARDAAIARLEAVPGLDSRMEHAARQLRRRIENARPPVIRF